MRTVVAMMIRTLKHYVHFFTLAEMLYVQSLKHLETVQAIEHSAMVNAHKKEWQQLLLITSYNRKGTKSPYILYGTQSKFYPTSRM